MAKRDSLEEFVIKSELVYGKRYDYSLVELVNDNTPVDIICKIHGVFSKKPGKHKQGQGCQKCSKESVALSVTHTKDTFVELSNEVHNELYNYSNVVLGKDNEKVDITCPIHGSFWQTPAHHKQGKGCPLCGKTKGRKPVIHSLVESTLKWNKVFGNKYDYSLVPQEFSNDTLIEIVCPVHGSFWRTPHRHVSGRGCAKCAEFGFNKSKEAHLYILKSGEVTKVGITNREPQVRVDGINRHSNMDFTIYSTRFYPDGIDAYLAEQKTLDWLRDNYEGVSERFDGYSECFKNVHINDLLAFTATV